MFNRWDVWWADVPFEDEPEIKRRPVIVVNAKEIYVFALKATSHAPREYDEYDVALTYWRECGLTSPTTVRVSKILRLNESMMVSRIGALEAADVFRLQQVIMRFRRK